MSDNYWLTYEQYIRFPIELAVRIDAAIPCGKGWISQGEKCHAGQGGVQTSRKQKLLEQIAANNQRVTQKQPQGLKKGDIPDSPEQQWKKIEANAVKSGMASHRIAAMKERFLNAKSTQSQNERMMNKEKESKSKNEIKEKAVELVEKRKQAKKEGVQVQNQIKQNEAKNQSRIKEIDKKVKQQSPEEAERLRKLWNAARGS